MQQCGVGLVHVRRDAVGLAFAAPPLRRTGPVEADVLAQIARSLHLDGAAISPSQWVDNGPGWVAVLLASRDDVLALRPDFAVMGELKVGVIAPWIAQDVPAQFEVRAFVPSLGVLEDPVTGSLNAGRAQWLIGAGLAPARYVVSQGTVMGRAGRVHVCRDGPGLWIGGASVSCVRGTPDGVSGSRCSRTDRRAARRRRAGRR